MSRWKFGTVSATGLPAAKDEGPLLWLLFSIMMLAYAPRLQNEAKKLNVVHPTTWSKGPLNYIFITVASLSNLWPVVSPHGKEAVDSSLELNLTSSSSSSCLLWVWDGLVCVHWTPSTRLVIHSFTSWPLLVGEGCWCSRNSMLMHFFLPLYVTCFLILLLYSAFDPNDRGLWY